MKVITIKQPWATLIAEGYKEYEFRTWKTNYRGPILIHAGKGIDKKDMEKFKHLNLNYPSGCIIAKANLTDCIYVTDDMGKKLFEQDPLVYNNLTSNDWNGYGFKLQNVTKISQVPINGQLGLWNYE